MSCFRVQKYKEAVSGLCRNFEERVKVGRLSPASYHQRDATLLKDTESDTAKGEK